MAYLRIFAWSYFILSLFRVAFFRLFARSYFVFSLFRVAFFVFSLGVISPGEKTNNEITKWHKPATIFIAPMIKYLNT